MFKLTGAEKLRPNLLPMFKWSGGKRDELKVIMPLVPEFERYFEPFVGGGALLFHLQPQKSVINDTHSDVIAFYRQIQLGNAGRLHCDLSALDNDEKTYYEVRSMACATEYERALQFYYLRKTCYRGMLRYNKQGQFNIPYGKYKTYNLKELTDKRYEEVLSRCEITLGDFEHCISSATDKDFIFLDPPYDCEFTTYGPAGQFTKLDHIRLSLCLRKTSSKWLMVISKTPFISMLYDDYVYGEYDKNYRFKLHSGRVSDTNCTHLVIKNY